jgi:hypothetical protein
MGGAPEKAGNTATTASDVPIVMSDIPSVPTNLPTNLPTTAQTDNVIAVVAIDNGRTNEPKNEAAVGPVATIACQTPEIKETNDGSVAIVLSCCVVCIVCTE